ncbi:hypothetical protein GGF46_001215 [Coemansia sp. RSA 552]|nr:hypothetical protein GGF46_001215 [Coemansia sp. RSA 552]
MSEQGMRENKDAPGLRISRMSMSNESVPRAKRMGPFKYNMTMMFQDRRLLKYLAHFIILCIISFLPLIFAGIALAFSSPSNAAKVAIYLVTLAIAIASIGFSARFSYQRLSRAVASRSRDSRTLPHTDVNIVGTPAEAFSPDQRHYSSGRQSPLSGHSIDMNHRDSEMPTPPPLPTARMPQSIIPPAPPLPGHSTPPPPPYQQGGMAEGSTLHQVPPPAHLPPPGAPQLPPGLFGAGGPHKSLGGDSDNDDTQLYSFEKINVQPEKSQGQWDDQGDRAGPGIRLSALPPSRNKDGYVENWVNTNGNRDDGGRGSSVYGQDTKRPATSSFDDLVGTMLESFTDSSRPSNNASRPPPPSVPLPTLLPYDDHTKDAGASSSNQRKEDARRKMLAQIRKEASTANSDDGFLDSDSDGMSSRGVSPRDAPHAGSGDKWKPASVNFENIAAHIAQALNQSDGLGSTLSDVRTDSRPIDRDSVSIEMRTPDISPRRAEQRMTPPAQRAVVHTRPPAPPTTYEIPSMSSSGSFDDDTLDSTRSNRR